MKIILRASLAGGVAVGSTCSMFIPGGVALLIGLFAGIFSALSFIYLQPRFHKTKEKEDPDTKEIIKTALFHDTCNVFSMHFVPGLIGAIMGCVMISMSNQFDTKENLEQIFPQY